MPESTTRWFTFGSGQAHRINGFTYDPDIVVEITAPDPRAVMEQWFGMKWSMEYGSLDDVGMEWYPRGVKVLP